MRRGGRGRAGGRGGEEGLAAIGPTPRFHLDQLTFRCLHRPSSTLSSASYARRVRPCRRRGLADQTVLHFSGRGARVRERLAQRRGVWRERRAGRGAGGAEGGISGAGAVRVGVVGRRSEAGWARGRGVVVVVVMVGVVVVMVVVRRGWDLIGGGAIPLGGRRR